VVTGYEQAPDKAEYIGKRLGQVGVIAATAALGGAAGEAAEAADAGAAGEGGIIERPTYEPRAPEPLPPRTPGTAPTEFPPDPTPYAPTQVPGRACIFVLRPPRERPIACLWAPLFRRLPSGAP
jgi:hypothetical protein